MMTWNLTPAEPTPEMIDRGVKFAMKTAITGDYPWPRYIADFYRTMASAAPDPLEDAELMARVASTVEREAAHVIAEKDKEIARLRAALEMMEAEARGASLYCSICGSCGEEGCGCTHKCVYAFDHPDVSERLAKLEAVAEAARDLSKAFRDDLCRRDHHGYCQSHFLEEDCSVERLLKALSALDGEKADG